MLINVIYTSPVPLKTTHKHMDSQVVVYHGIASSHASLAMNGSP
jgi:hypothetical protein